MEERVADIEERVDDDVADEPMRSDDTATLEITLGVLWGAFGAVEHPDLPPDPSWCVCLLFIFCVQLCRILRVRRKGK